MRPIQAAAKASQAAAGNTNDTSEPQALWGAHYRAPPRQATCAPGPTHQAARTWIREYFFDEEPGKRKHPAVIGPQPCFGMRLGAVSGGRVTQGCLESSHTEIVGPGKLGSAKVPMATAT